MCLEATNRVCGSQPRPLCRPCTCQGNKQPKTKLPAWLKFEINAKRQRKGEAGARTRGCSFFFGNLCGSTRMYSNARENNTHCNMPHSISRMYVQHCNASNGGWDPLGALQFTETLAFTVVCSTSPISNKTWQKSKKLQKGHLDGQLQKCI